MEDKEIIELYLTRAETAIENTSLKYGNYCFTIANNILKSYQDAEECVSEAYLKTWSNIPPIIPTSLRAFLGKITRNLSLDRYKFNRREKRSGGIFELLLDELEECIPDKVSAASVISLQFTSSVIDDWLELQKEDYRVLFVRRYWYSDSIAAIADRFGQSESKVKSVLFRMRKSLKLYLEKEGVDV